MFCSNCGKQLPDGSRFCTQCGAAQSFSSGEQVSEKVPQQVENPSEGMRYTQNPNLPEGIFQDESGAYHWMYQMDMLRNPVPLYTVFKIFFIIISIMAAFMLVLGLADGDGLEAFKNAAIMFFGINALFFVLGLMAWGIMAMTRGAVYNFEFLMTEQEVVMVQTKEERKRAQKLADKTFLLSILSGNLSMAGNAIHVANTPTFSSVYTAVRKIIAKPRNDLIKVNNVLQHNQIYAYPNQYAFVWNYIVSHCPNARVEGKQG